MSFSADRGNVGGNIFVITSSVRSQSYTTHGHLCQILFSADRGNVGGNIFVIISSARNRSECASVASSSTTVQAIARYGTTGVCCSCKVQYNSTSNYGTTGVCCSCKVQYYCTSNCKVRYYWGMLQLQGTVLLYQQLQGTVLLGYVAVARYSTTVPAIARYRTTGVCCSCKVQYYCASNCKVR